MLILQQIIYNCFALKKLACAKIKILKKTFKNNRLRTKIIFKQKNKSTVAKKIKHAITDIKRIKIDYQNLP